MSDVPSAAEHARVWRRLHQIEHPLSACIKRFRRAKKELLSHAQHLRATNADFASRLNTAGVEIGSRIEDVFNAVTIVFHMADDDDKAEIGGTSEGRLLVDKFIDDGEYLINKGRLMVEDLRVFSDADMDALDPVWRAFREAEEEYKRREMTFQTDKRRAFFQDFNNILNGVGLGLGGTSLVAAGVLGLVGIISMATPVGIVAVGLGALFFGGLAIWAYFYEPSKRSERPTPPAKPVTGPTWTPENTVPKKEIVEWRKESTMQEKIEAWLGAMQRYKERIHARYTRLVTADNMCSICCERPRETTCKRCKREMACKYCAYKLSCSATPRCVICQQSYQGVDLMLN